jgi:hypothetical protein
MNLRKNKTEHCVSRAIAIERQSGVIHEYKTNDLDLEHVSIETQHVHVRYMLCTHTRYVRTSRKRFIGELIPPSCNVQY